MAMQPAKTESYIIRCFPPHLRFLLFSDKLPLLTLRWHRDPPLKRLKRFSQRLACRLGHPLQPSGVDPKSLTKRANFTALLQMPRRHCKMCRSPLHVDDTHAESVLCLGKSHADAALSGTDCSHCESFSLASLRSRIAFFSESDSIPCALPFSSSQGPVTSYNCEIEKDFSLKKKKKFFPNLRRYLDAVPVLISQGTEVTIVTEYVIAFDERLKRFFGKKICVFFL